MTIHAGGIRPPGKVWVAVSAERAKPPVLESPAPFAPSTARFRDRPRATSTARRASSARVTDDELPRPATHRHRHARKPAGPLPGQPCRRPAAGALSFAD